MNKQTKLTIKLKKAEIGGHTYSYLAIHTDNEPSIANMGIWWIRDNGYESGRQLLTYSQILNNPIYGLFYILLFGKIA